MKKVLFTLLAWITFTVSMSGQLLSGVYSAMEFAGDVPAAPADLEAVFAPESLSGQISFTAPTKTYAGEGFTGNLRFTVFANEEKVSEGTVYTGVNRSIDVTVPKVGVYDFKVTVKNDAGESPAATIKVYIGYSQPAAPTVTASDYYGSLKVEWTPVTTTVDGNPLNGEVTYKVVRYPDETVVAESTTDTDLVDRIPASEGVIAYSYGVKAIAFGTSSREAFSGKVVTGKIIPPYTENFMTSDVLDFCVIADANGDGRTWSFYNGEMRAEASPTVAADDWLISPPIAIEGFKYYVVSIDVKSESSAYPGKFEMKYGTSPTAEGMTIDLIPVTEVPNEKYLTYKGTVRVFEDKNYYFGVHAVTEPDMWWMRVTNFSVSAPVDGAVPETISDLTILPDPSGALSTDIAFTAPSKTLAGEVLSSLTKIELLRDGELIKTFDNPGVGAKLTWKDTNIAEKGTHRYAVAAVNASGSGLETVKSVFVGINLPASPLSARAFETDVNGEVTIEWEAPETFIDGSPMNPDLVTYNVYTSVEGQDIKIQTGLKGNSVTFQAIFPGEPQMFFYYGVSAETEAGENTAAVVTQQIPLGEPYAAPYADSFANVGTEYAYGIGGDDNRTFWDFYSDSRFEDVVSQDNDNGMLAMYGHDKGNSAYFSTGKVDLTGLQNPVLTFYLFNMVGSLANENTVEVQVDDRSGFQSMATYRLGDLGEEGWHRVELSLSEYIGKSVRFKIIGTIQTYQYIHLDNIQLRDRSDYDMVITDISAPERIKAGSEGSVVVSWQNQGLKDATDLVFELRADGETIASRTVDKAVSDSKGVITFPIVQGVTSPDEVEYVVEIKFAADQQPGNNVSDPFVVRTISPDYPVVDDLKAGYNEADPQTIVLSWSEPDLSSSFDDEITDGFESYAAWAKSGVGDWKFVDGDGGEIYGFGSYFELPGIPSGSQQSFWVMNDQYQPLVDHFSSPDFYVAHSGHQYIAQMSVTKGESTPRCDDWAISPKLNGKAQTISFFARSFFDTDPESFEIRYSTAGSDVADFVLLETKTGVPNTWTQYYFDLPEGATYFAIHCISRDCFMLMIDDVTFTPAGTGSDLEIEGYNIYRNRVKINEAPVTATRFSTVRTGENDVFTVSVLYKNRGESQLSNEAIPTLSGIDETDMGALVRIMAADGVIRIETTESRAVEIYTADGRIVASFRSTGSDTVSVAAGIYVVKAGGMVKRVVVR